MRKQLLTMAATATIMFTSFNGQASAHENNYQVRSGDTLWKIAQANNLSIQQILDWNSLSSTVIYPGQTISLLAPHSHEETSKSYTVQYGDTLWIIANKFNMGVYELKSMNSLASDVIYPGQKLLVKSGSILPAPPSQQESVNTYKVQSGDTLWIIANKFNVTIAQLKSINQLNSDIINVGQTLVIPNSSTSGQFSSPATTVDALIAEAKKYIGVPYVWGGSTPAGFDCSGYLNYVFNHVGLSIPRTVAAIWSEAKPVSSLKAGDIVFFNTGSSPSHAGIYLGNNQFIHAGTSTGVTISDLGNSYWKPRYMGAKTFF
jgi:peptidoglycan DL-endopeptidase LytE